MAPQSEQDFLARYDPAEFERPSVATDVVVLTVIDGCVHTLLYERERHPFLHAYALPGGFVGIDEGLEEAARRLLRGKGGLDGVWVEQLRTFGRPARDPGCA